ncbi:MAG: OST-HTH/LOTUS domain-containing protein [Bacillota bacterium]|nr:OST-HTH/LOTUS domain-containing protein [Bacillota bacterium]
MYLEILDSEDDEDEHEADERQQPAERSSGQSGRQGRGGEKQNQSADSSQAAKPNRNITTATSAAERQLLSGTAGEERAPVPREQGRRQRRTIHKIDEATRRLVKNCVADLADENGWSYLGDVGTLILKVRPSFDPRNYGYQKLTPMMRAIPGIEIDERSMGQGNARHIFIRNTETEERT